MKRMTEDTIRAINTALRFSSGEAYRAPEMRPWQAVQMEYERVGLIPPAEMPDFETVEDAEIWMCLDSRYNARLRENACFSWQVAV